MALSQNPRWTLRDLPLPAKWVVSVFLIAVGLGYFSALVQLHFKHASAGNPLPTPSDVVARYSGQVWPLEAEQPNALKEEKQAEHPVNSVMAVKVKTILQQRCVLCHAEDGEASDWLLHTFDGVAKYLEPTPKEGKIYKLITADEDAAWGKDSSMRQAFTRKSEVDGKSWKEQIQERSEAELRKEREQERLGLVAWLQAGAPKQAYEQDSFLPTRTIQEKPLTAAEKAKKRQISVDGLTQSTHAHLLSFAMLFALTGLTFSFTSYPTWIRLIGAPWVLTFQVLEVSCWWLARLDGIGPYFALGIVGMGGLVGAGLGLQILGSLWNMYDAKGKTCIAFLGLLACGGGFVAYEKVIAPQLAAEKQEVVK